MSYKLNILRPEEIKETIFTFFREKSLIPIVGSGISCGASAHNGNIPSGEEYKEHMIKELSDNVGFSPDEKKDIMQENFSTLCDYYEDDENVPASKRLLYLKQHFYGSTIMDNDIRKSFFEIEWPYIYSLNIDDAIENSSIYKKIILPNREFRDEIFRETKCLIKLHGDINEIVTYKDGDKIFTSKEYALSLEKNASLLNKLRNDYIYQNILYIGCSLADEVDLKTLSNIPVDFQVKENLSKTIMFVLGMPGKLQQSKYKVYGITDVVCFDNYDSMYDFLTDTWREAAKIREDELGHYSNMSMNTIKSVQKFENQNYFLWGKGLFDLKNKSLNYPYYFIARNITSNIVENISKNKVHLVYGARISGKSYLLADLYRTIRDREVYYFDGKSRLSEYALKNLINLKKSLVLFDIGTLDRDQFECILLNSKLINQNESNFVINVNDNDSDTLGIVKWKLRQGIIQTTDIISYNINNKLSSNGKMKELDTINSLLPFVNLPPYSPKRTILDQLIYVEKELQMKGRFTKRNIKIDKPKQLALLIVLAIKERLYSLDIVSFAFDQEIDNAIKKYTPFIERVESFDFEKDSSDLSHVKYVLNSKYWLRRELGNYARMGRNDKTIAEAYKYIIRKVLEMSGNNEYKQRKLCRSYILFDVINDVFLDEYGGNLKLIVNLYTQLHEFLATDFNFLHQNAKCYLNYAYSLKDVGEKGEYLKKSQELAVVAKLMIENRYEESNNERLLISAAHTQYTIATVMCELCKLSDYSIPSELEIAIDEVNKALISPYNNDDYQREKNQRTPKGIVDFLSFAFINATKLNISENYNKKLTGLMNTSISGSKYPK